MDHIMDLVTSTTLQEKYTHSIFISYTKAALCGVLAKKVQHKLLKLNYMYKNKTQHFSTFVLHQFLHFTHACTLIIF